MVKNISVYSDSVIQLVFWRFNGWGDTILFADQIKYIFKNIFKIKENVYCELVDQFKISWSSCQNVWKIWYWGGRLDQSLW